MGGVIGGAVGGVIGDGSLGPNDLSYGGFLPT